MQEKLELANQQLNTKNIKLQLIADKAIKLDKPWLNIAQDDKKEHNSYIYTVKKKAK